MGMLTGTIFPYSSLNGGPSLVPEKLSKAYLGLFKGSEMVTGYSCSRSDHARSAPKVGQQTLEEMFLEYVPPSRRYCRVGPLVMRHPRK